MEQKIDYTKLLTGSSSVFLNEFKDGIEDVLSQMSANGEGTNQYLTKSEVEKLLDEHFSKIEKTVAYYTTSSKVENLTETEANGRVKGLLDTIASTVSDFKVSLQEAFSRKKNNAIYQVQDKIDDIRLSMKNGFNMRVLLVSQSIKDFGKKLDQKFALEEKVVKPHPNDKGKENVVEVVSDEQKQPILDSKNQSVPIGTKSAEPSEKLSQADLLKNYLNLNETISAQSKEVLQKMRSNELPTKEEHASLEKSKNDLKETAAQLTRTTVGDYRQSLIDKIDSLEKKSNVNSEEIVKLTATRDQLLSSSDFLMTNNEDLKETEKTPLQVFRETDVKIESLVKENQELQSDLNQMKEALHSSDELLNIVPEDPSISPEEAQRLSQDSESRGLEVEEKPISDDKIIEGNALEIENSIDESTELDKQEDKLSEKDNDQKATLSSTDLKIDKSGRTIHQSGILVDVEASRYINENPNGHYWIVDWNETWGNGKDYAGQLVTLDLLNELKIEDSKYESQSDFYFKVKVVEIKDGQAVSSLRIDIGDGVSVNQHLYEKLSKDVVAFSKLEPEKNVIKDSLDSSNEAKYTSTNFVEQVFNSRVKGDEGTWGTFKNEAGEEDLNIAWMTFVQDASQVPEWGDEYFEFFFEGGKEAYDSHMENGSELHYSQAAIDQFTKLFDQYIEQKKEAAEDIGSLPVEEFIEGKSVQEIIAAKDYKALSNHLKEGVSSYLNSDTFKKYLDFFSNFHKYTQKNVRLLLAQNPNITHVASFNKWKELGRPVEKGAKALYVYSPSTKIKKDENGEPIKDENGEVVKTTRFLLTPVFDVSQTSGDKEIPKPVYALPENLEDPNRFPKLYQALKELSPAAITIDSIESSANGFYRPSDNTITVRKGLGEEMTLKTLIHEITHAMLHTDSNASFGDTTYRRQEFEAESVAYIVTNHLGIDSSDYSFGYLSSWTQCGNKIDDLTDSLEVITKQAQEMISHLDTVLEKVYTVEVPKNKFEERIAEARIEKNASITPPVKQVAVADPKENSPSLSH